MVPIRAILFRRITNTDFQALNGETRGQYDVRLTSDPEIGGFFSGLKEEAPTERGGWSKSVPFEPFEGADPVAARFHKLGFYGPEGARPNNYYFASQRPDTAYPLWRVGRAFPAHSAYEDVAGAVLVVVRDIEDRYHARWVRRDNVGTLPSVVQEVLTKGTGVLKVTTSHPTNVSAMAQRVMEALRMHHNVLLYGPPATGKTHLVTEVREAFGTAGILLDTAEEREPLTDVTESVHSAWATFHQNYSYEDFLLGLRPEPNEGGGFRLEAVPGVLLELSEWARTAKRSSLLIIDEINRGNVSRIFGEFITLMEPDKRLAADGTSTATTVTVRLPLLQQGTNVRVPLPDGTEREVSAQFTMPYRLFTLATMNSVDKSVAPLDAALRRRFHVIELPPKLDELRDAFEITGDAGMVPASLDTVADVQMLALALLARLNERLAMFLGTDFQFGQWYLGRLIGVTEPSCACELLADVWRTTLFPQLAEHFAGRTEQLLGVLGEASSSDALSVDEPSLLLEELGATKIVRMRYDAGADAVLELLRRIASAT